jgi:hypothetical protein
MTTEEHLERWAAARERRNGPDGHGKTGTNLLREAAQEIRNLKQEIEEIHENYEDWIPQEQA